MSASTHASHRWRAAASNLYVLDAHALLSYFFDEPGGDRIRQLIEESAAGTSRLYTCVINVAETLYWTQRRRGSVAFAEVAEGREAMALNLAFGEGAETGGRRSRFGQDARSDQGGGAGADDRTARETNAR